MRDLKIPHQRHPEKVGRPDNPQPKKPAWIRAVSYTHLTLPTILLV